MSAPLEIKAQVLGVDRVIAHFVGAPDRVHAAVRRAVAELGAELQRKVKAEKLTGQVLKVQTGRLRRSVNLRAESTPAAEIAKVGTNVAYGRFWELGFHGEVTVKAHVRKTKLGGTAAVKSHRRRVDVEPRPFLQPALAEMKAKSRQRILGAVAEAM